MMRKWNKIIQINLILIVSAFSSCTQESSFPKLSRPSWNSRRVDNIEYSSLAQGMTYLPLYSHIYYIQENKPFYLTSTVSIRNVSKDDKAYLLSADYFDTDGNLVRSYLQEPIYLNPLETVEVVIAESDIKGGSGANFLFKWAVGNELNPILFEAVMISTSGQQGLSFTSRGVRVY
ncbi:MAG: DUF3124 domain-containing protein [Spirochaetales bacterium]|nr:DUF3124 domain-containing protein [Spirochaetales bacterium]